MSTTVDRERAIIETASATIPDVPTSSTALAPAKMLASPSAITA
jgi:hypothetical protein